MATSKRVGEGGHDVPEDKIRSRLPRTIENLKKAIPIADEVHLLDNSLFEDPFKRIASLIVGHTQVHTNVLPQWAGADL